MGAVYNHQNIKGVVHFATIVGLFQLTAIHVASGFFLLAGLASYLYSIVDAYRTGQLIARGATPAADEERFKRSLIKRAPVIGIMLITAGLLLVIQIVPAGIITSQVSPRKMIFFGIVIINGIEENGQIILREL
jgi:hypothetical protein